MINIAKQKTITVNYKDLITTTISEKFPYFLIGATVVLIILLFLAINFRKSLPQVPQKIEDKKIESTAPTAETKKYTVKEGDYLWKIAEDAYGSGYNAYDIAMFNKITDANVIESGQVLVLPSVQAKTPTKGDIEMTNTKQVSFSGKEYTVKEGDYLWKIALEAYGDGYAWTRIASANKISKPDLIYPNTKLTIPR